MMLQVKNFYLNVLWPGTSLSKLYNLVNNIAAQDLDTNFNFHFFLAIHQGYLAKRVVTANLATVNLLQAYKNLILAIFIDLINKPFTFNRGLKLGNIQINCANQF